MTIASPELRAAKATLAAERKRVKAARPKVVPVRDGRQREPRQRDNLYLQFLRRQRCCLELPGLLCDGPTQAAHIRTPKPGEKPTGLQRKPDDARATPLCAHHHRRQHEMNEMVFWTMRGKDPFAIAEAHYQQFKQGAT